MPSRLRSLTLIATLCATALAGAPAAAQTSADARFRAAQERFDREYDLYRQEVDRYQTARSGGGAYRQAPDRYPDDRRFQGGYDDSGSYDPARDYRDGAQYRERVLSTDDRVYAGYDGRYYCKRSDGTTGLIVGGAAGGLLGNVIDGGRSRTVGTLLGAAAGALAGKAIDQNQQQVRCR
ncbi:glycine zipper 2TM domain-containing protein [Sphingomonas sp. KR1UV-12]|uniref:17 kDa surface antigen n=1 Tax=Sphingomonas aurea TaxID=3063994 RepID=A0ABT9EHV6_9SPHN|nr:glycine zipper 2TM domain-containing protein [Sphingomonas sp. KR1UV-12]MDP1026545.1 glycine zipper 2TM domain-containing protein [Sphingomonas sp. KR1UV-12]